MWPLPPRAPRAYKYGRGLAGFVSRVLGLGVLPGKMAAAGVPERTVTRIVLHFGLKNMLFLMFVGCFDGYGSWWSATEDIFA